MKHLVVTFIGPDKPGLVDTLSNIVSSHQGNWQTSSMHHLSGHFAGVFEVAVADDKCQQLSLALTNVEGLTVTIEQATPTDSQAAAVVLELTANDRAGIVQEVSSVIHKQGGNLLKLVSTQDAAPHSGQLMFKAKAQVAVEDASIDELIEALESIADDLMVDITK